MSAAEGSRARVSDRLAELRRQYGPVPVHQRTWTVPSDRYERVAIGVEPEVVVEVADDEGELVLARAGHHGWPTPGTVIAPASPRPTAGTGRAAADRPPEDAPERGDASDGDGTADRGERTCVVDGLERVTIVGVRTDEGRSRPHYRLVVRWRGHYERRAGAPPTADPSRDRRWAAESTGRGA